MSDIQRLLTSLDEREIAAKATNKHDEARMRYSLEKNTVSSFEEFEEAIADYYDYHFKIASNGGNLSRSECRSRAKQAIERYYQRRERGDIRTAYLDAKDGTNGGLRVILDILTDAFKEESQRHYVTDVFDQLVKPNSFEQKTEIIAQFLKHLHPTVTDSVDVNDPKRYAENYRDLIQAYVDALRTSHRPLRRL